MGLFCVAVPSQVVAVFLKGTVQMLANVNVSDILCR